MLRANSYVKAGEWPQPAKEQVMLDYDGRRRRRMTLECLSGFKFLLDLAKAPTLVEGDGLVLENGDMVEVRAAPEALLKITCANPTHLARIAYHLGNRHLPVEVGEGVLYIRIDHVIEQMVIDLGADVRHLDRPFYPEGGAYGEHKGGHSHGHSHGHGHSHAE